MRESSSWSDTIAKLRDSSRRWEPSELITPDGQVITNNPATDAAGSVRERALKMELADTEAAQKEQQYQQSKRESFLHKIRDRWSKPTAPSAPDVRTELKTQLDMASTERVTRLRKMLSTRDINTLETLYAVSLEDVLSPTQLLSLTHEQKQLAKKMISEAAYDKVLQLTRELPANILFDIEHAGTPDDLFIAVGSAFAPPADRTMEEPVFRRLVRDKLDKKITTEHHRLSEVEQAIDTIQRAFEQKLKAFGRMPLAATY